MDRKLTIFYTSDIHGYFSPMDYAGNRPAATGLANCAANFLDDGNTLILDGGDTLQGSPFTYWLYSRTAERSLVPARLMNLAGYHFVTLGNHDFNYGAEELQRYINALDAKCLCANVEGLDNVGKTALVTLKNGLRVGITAITSQAVPSWEKPENIAGLRFTDAFKAARDALAALKAQKPDFTLCVYHGGFEVDVLTGKRISDTLENQGWRICQELDFDLMLSGHQHMPFENCRVNGTYTCQPPARAGKYIRVDAHFDENSALTLSSRLCPAGDKTPAAFTRLLAPLEARLEKFLDAPMGRLDTALTPSTPLKRALKGSLVANLINQIQLEASGAQLSCTSLSGSIRGFAEEITMRDIVASYVFPNTLKTIRVNRTVLEKAFERAADYFTLDENGEPCVSEAFLKPIQQHYNFDFISGVRAVIDIRREPGERVLSIRYEGEELPPDKPLTLCLNNYRATGAGGFEFYTACETLREQPEEVCELIAAYVDRHREITVDKTRWLEVRY